MCASWRQCGVVLVTVIGVASLLGCTPTRSAPPEAPGSATEVPVESPVIALTDPSSDDYIADQLELALDATGTGETRLHLDEIGPVAGVTFYVACSPRSNFTVRAFDNFFSGPCGPRFENMATIPVGEGGVVDSMVALDIPEGVDFHIVALATQ